MSAFRARLFMIQSPDALQSTTGASGVEGSANDSDWKTDLSTSVLGTSGRDDTKRKEYSMKRTLLEGVVAGILLTLFVPSALYAVASANPVS